MTDLPTPARRESVRQTHDRVMAEIRPPRPTPAASLWAEWQAKVARDPLEAAAWYQTLPAADQATLSALTLAQCAAALTGPPVEPAQVAARLRTWVGAPR